MTRIKFDQLPAVHEGSVVILWADVVGFSGLSSRLAEQWDGRELVAQAVGDLIAQGLSAAVSCGATPVSLGGDSWIVVWSGAGPEQQSSQKALTLASEAARLSHLICSQLSERHQLSLQLRVVCASGPARWFSVPVSGQRTSRILRGPVISTAGKLFAQCQPGATVIWDGLNSTSEAPLPSTASEWPEAPASAKGSALSNSQRGVCTVVYAAADIEASSYAAAEGAMLALLKAARSLCEVFSGRVARMRVDEKGCTLLIVFGFGSAGSEDNAKNGIGLARALRSMMASEIPRLGIGVGSGRVFACEVGHGNLTEFTVMGECINAAAKAAALLGHEIWCDALTAQMAGTYIRDGRSTGAGGQGHSLVPIIGRPQLIEKLRCDLQAAQCVCLVGDAGSGKSTLLVQLQGVLQSTPSITVLKGQCAREHVLGFGSPIAQLLLAWVGSAAASLTAQEKLLADTASRCSVELRPVVAYLSELLQPQTSADAPIGNRIVNEQLPAFCAWWMTHCLEGAHYLFVEDVHWLDPLSSACLRAMREANSGIGLLLTSRLLPIQTDGLPDAQVVQVARLSLIEIEHWLQRALQVKAVQPALIEHALQTTSGHCMFLSRWIPEAVQRGWYRVIDECAVLLMPSMTNRSMARETPIELQFLLQSEIERVDEDAKLLLAVVAAFGRQPTMGQLGGLMPHAFHLQMGPALAQCIERKILTLHALGSEVSEIRFSHALLSETCYNRLDIATRASVHAHIATTLEAPSGITSTPMERAWHWMRARSETAETYEKILLGALWARKVNAPGIALELLEYAKNGYRQLGPKFRNRCQDAELWLAITGCELGKTREASAALRKAALLRYPSRPQALAQITYLARHMLFFVVHYAGLMRPTPLREDQSIFEDPQHRALLILVESSYFEGDFKSMVWYASCSMDAVSRSRSLSSTVSMYAGMTVQWARLNQDRLANACASLSLRLARSSRQGFDLVEVLMFLALRDVGCGRWHQAIKHADLALRRNRQIGHGRRHDELLVVKGYALQGSEHYAQAAEVFGALWRSGAARGDQQTEVWGLVNVARQAYLQGDDSTMRAYLEQLADQSIPDVLTSIGVDALRAADAVLNNNLAYCEDILQRWPPERVLAMSQVTFSVAFEIGVLYTLSEVMRFQAAGGQYPADDLPRQYLNALQVAGKAYPFSRGRYWLCQGIFSRLRGHTTKAASAFETGIRTALEFKQPQLAQRIKNIRDVEEPMPQMMAKLFISADRRF